MSGLLQPALRGALAAALLGTLVPSALAEAGPRWGWEDHFTAREQDQLTAWIEQAQHGLVALFGPLPFSYTARFHRLEGRGEPVPWANTVKRGDQRAVKFYVDPAYSAERFARDWTASHELAHLLFPYLGRSGMWFAEGIASYLQYQIMYAAGVLAWEEATDRYAERFRRAAEPGPVAGVPIVELPAQVRRTGSYVRLYWGGAALFLEADHRLAETRGLRLHDVIRRYLRCCYGQGDDAMALLALFDELAGSRAFREAYEATVAGSEFPEVRTGLAWLRDNPPPLATIPAPAPSP